jgi:hypothetical protein
MKKTSEPIELSFRSDNFKTYTCVSAEVYIEGGGRGEWVARPQAAEFKGGGVKMF